jgi:nucleoid-associated protein YgaU
MVLKGFDFLKAETGIRESFQEAGSTTTEDTAALHYLVLTDGVSATSATETDQPARDAALLAEESLRDYLDNIHEGTLTEDALIEAFNHANRKVLELFDDADTKVAVSALVIALAPNRASVDGTAHGEDLIIAGVGDMKVFALRPEKTEEIFCDQSLPQGLTPAERAEKLTHALGSTEKLSVSTLRKEQSLYQRYVALSYGLTDQMNADEIFSIGLRPHHPESGIKSLLRNKSGENNLRACTLTYEVEKDPLFQSTSEAMSAPTAMMNLKRQRDRYIAMGASIAATALVLGTAFQLLEDDPTPLLSPQMETETVKVEAKKEAEPLLVQESPEENSWVVALKEQSRRQQEKIDQLSEELKTKQQKIFDLESLVGTTTSDEKMEMFDRLNSKILEKEEQIAKLKEANLNFQTQLQSTRFKSEDLRTTIAKHEEDLQTTRGQLTEMTQLQSQLTTLRNDFAAKEKTIQQLTAEKMDLEAKLAAGERESEELEKLLGEVETQKTTKQNELTDLQKENTRLTQLSSGLETLKNQYKEQADAIEKMRQNREAMVQQIIAAEKLTSELKSQLATATDDKHQVESDLKRSESRYEAYQAEMQREIAKLQNSQKNELQTYEQNARSLNDKIAKLEQQALEGTRQNREIEAKTTTKLQEMEQTLARKDAQLEALASAKTESAKLDKQLAAMSTSFQKLEAEKQDLTNQLATLKHKAEEQEKGLVSSRETVMNYSQRYSELEKQLTAKLDDLSHQYETLQTKYASMEKERGTQVDRMTANYQQEKERSATLERKVEEILAGAQNSVPSSQMEMEVAKANRRIKELEQEYAEKIITLNESVKAEQKKAAEMEQACAKARKETLAMQEELNETVANAQNSNMAQLNSNERKELESQIESLVHAKAAAEAEKSALAEQMAAAEAAAEAEKSTLAEQMATAEAEKSALANAKAAAEREQAELESQILTVAKDKSEAVKRASVIEDQLHEALSKLEELATLANNAEESKKTSTQEFAELKSAYDQKMAKLADTQLALQTKYETIIADLEQKQSMTTSELDLYKKKSQEQQQVVESSKYVQNELSTKFQDLKESNASLLREKSILQEKVGALEEFQEMYAKEHTARLEQEKQFNEIRDAIGAQKEQIASIEKARSMLADELKKVKNDYNELSTGQSVAQTARPAATKTNTTAAKATTPTAKTNQATTATTSTTPKTTTTASTVPAKAAPTTAKTSTATATASIASSSKDMAFADDAKLRNSSQSSLSNTTPAATSGATRVHLVSRGETLSGISQRYYGTATRWKEIYEANKDDIGDINRVKVGTALVIP